MSGTGATDIRPLKQLHNRWRGFNPALLIFLISTALVPAVAHGKDGWGCEVGADGKWNCFWSGEGEPPAQQIQTPPAPLQPKSIAAPVKEPQQAPNASIVAAPVEKEVPETESNPQSKPVSESGPETVEKSTFGRVRSWFGLGGDEPSEASSANQETSEPDLAQEPVTAPVPAQRSQNVRSEKNIDVPQPKAEDVSLAEQSTSTEQEEKDEGASTLQRLRGWLGWSSDEKEDPVEKAQQEPGPEPEVVDVEQPAPVVSPVMQNKPITEDAVIRPLDSSAGSAEKSAATSEKPSTMGKMKKWFGLSEREPAQQDERSKAEQQSVIAEIKQYQDFSVSPDLSDLQFTPAKKRSSEKVESSVENRPSPASRVKSWLGFSEKRKPEAEKNLSTDEGSATKPPGMVASRAPPVQIIGVDSDRVTEKKVSRELPTSMIKPDASTTDEKRAATTKKEKPSWFSRVGSWFGLGGKDKKAANREVVTVMPDMKIEDVPAK